MREDRGGVAGLRKKNVKGDGGTIISQPELKDRRRKYV